MILRPGYSYCQVSFACQSVDHFLRFSPAARHKIIMEIRSIAIAPNPEGQEEIRGAGLVLFRASTNGPEKSGVCGMQARDQFLSFSPYYLFV
jgi:hypothetical protein